VQQPITYGSLHFAHAQLSIEVRISRKMAKIDCSRHENIPSWIS